MKSSTDPLSFIVTNDSYEAEVIGRKNEATREVVSCLNGFTLAQATDILTNAAIMVKNLPIKLQYPESSQIAKENVSDFVKQNNNMEGSELCKSNNYPSAKITHNHSHIVDTPNGLLAFNTERNSTGPLLGPSPSQYAIVNVIN